MYNFVVKFNDESFIIVNCKSFLTKNSVSIFVWVRNEDDVNRSEFVAIGNRSFKVKHKDIHSISLA